MELTKKVILGIAISWCIYYLLITVRGITLIGIKDYWKHVIRRDKRKLNVAYFLFMWVIARILCPFFMPCKLSAEMNFLIDLALLIPLFKLIAPPQVLLLHTFAKRKEFSRKLNWTVAIGNVVSLSPPLPKNVNETFAKLVTSDVDSGLESKLCTSENWRDTVEKSIEMAEVIVLDLSLAGKGVIEEMKMLAEKKKDLKKLLLVYRDSESDANGLSAIPEELKDGIPLHSYKEIGFFSEGKILQSNFRKEIHKRGKLLVPEWVIYLLTIGLFALIFIESP